MEKKNKRVIKVEKIRMGRCPQHKRSTAKAQTSQTEASRKVLIREKNQTNEEPHEEGKKRRPNGGKEVQKGRSTPTNETNESPQGAQDRGKRAKVRSGREQEKGSRNILDSGKVRTKHPI